MPAAAPAYFVKNLLLFGRLLRLMGLDVGVSDMVELADALTRIELARKADVYHAARSVLVRCHEDYPLFDQAWQAFWRKPSNQRLQRLELQADPRLLPKPLRVPHAARGEGDAEGRRKPQEEIVAHQQSFSANELLRSKDFGAFTWEEVQAARRLMAQMHWRIGERRLRRRKPVSGGEYLDLRRAVRANLRYGGELLALAWKRRKTKPRPLVILCDISGSMEQYARMLLHFIHTISAGFDFDRVEAFVFSTRLTRITRQLAHRDVDDAMDAVEGRVQDWGGGTRTGEALHGFNFHWARRVLGRGAVVMIISDGWDRGDPQALAREMERLQKSCHRLIWLNPLIGSEGYQPLTQGLVAALPYVDDFLSVRNLDSLESLGQTLSQLSERRPARRQKPVRMPEADAAFAPADDQAEVLRRAQEREATVSRLRKIVRGSN